LDGNPTGDSRNTYTWDAENRLIGITPKPIAIANRNGAPLDTLTFAYDDQGRRVMKQVSTQLATGTETTVRTCFLHDGWNIIAEMRASMTGTNTTGFARQRVYSWGVDMSGSTTGAGGVGGLAFVGEYTLAGTTAFTSTLSRPLAPAYDPNGNVIGYFDCRATTSGTATATISSSSGRKMVYTFEYDAFGRELMADLTQAGSTTTFPASVAPPIRFSTKYSDIESGWVYYGYRYYSPEMGRWVSRDPIEERGGKNLYEMVGNDTVNQRDYLGLFFSAIAYDLIDRLLNDGVTWAPDPCPGSTGALSKRTTETRFIQVIYQFDYGDSPERRRRRNNGRVDDGSLGFGSHDAPFPPGSPFYPIVPNDDFRDQPAGFTTIGTRFEVCRVCWSKCGSCVFQIGPCKNWYRLDSGDMGLTTPSSPRMNTRPTTSQPSPEFWSAFRKKHAGTIKYCDQ
jgi:RHS repeat-associated protein